MAVGLDPSRPAHAAVALTAQGRALVGSLRDRAHGLTGSGPVSGIADQTLTALREHPGHKIHIRLILPAQDSATLTRHLRTSLESLGLRTIPTPAGPFAALCADSLRLAAIRCSTRQVIVDMLIGLSVEATQAQQQALRAIDEQDSSGTQTAPALEGNVARLQYAPATLAQAAFAFAAAELLSVLPEADANARNQLAAEVLQSGAEGLRLASSDSGALFRRLELSFNLEGVFPTLLGRGHFGPGYSPALAPCAPSISVDLPRGAADSDTALRCLEALSAPGDRFTANPPGTDFLSRVYGAGAWGDWVALGFHPMTPVRSAIRSSGIDLSAILRLERFGRIQYPAPAEDLYWGLLRPETTAQEASCALASSSPPCKAKSRLTEGAVREFGGLYARLVRVDGRYVLVMSKDRSSVAAARPSLTPSPTTPLRLYLASQTVAHELKNLSFPVPPPAYEVNASVQDRQLVVRIAPWKAP